MGGYIIRLKYEALVGTGVAAYIAAYNAAGQIPGIRASIQATLGWLGVVGAVISFFVQPLRADKNKNGIPDSEEAAMKTSADPTGGTAGGPG
jgi:hypothetical protein